MQYYVNTQNIFIINLKKNENINFGLFNILPEVPSVARDNAFGFFWASKSSNLQKISQKWNFKTFKVVKYKNESSSVFVF